MLDCKNALAETDGDFDKAVELLRIKGAKDVGKRAERATAEGLVAAKGGALIELNSETDFVAKNPDFRSAAAQIAALKAKYLTRDDVPEDVVANERRIAEETARNEGKPEQALAKIVEGRVTGFYKEFMMLDQPVVSEKK